VRNDAKSKDKFICKYNRTPLIRIIGRTRYMEMQEIRIIGIFFENRLHWHYEVKEKILQTADLGYIFIYIQIKLMHNSLYVFEKWWKSLIHKKT
jgi:hypothetical protein